MQRPDTPNTVRAAPGGRTRGPASARRSGVTPISARPQQGRSLLSACLIVRDEEERLPRCLAALAGLVDEVVVHDTGSVDRTVAIARASGATVIEGSWHDDFALARNVALDACTGTWILQVDADEELRVPTLDLRAALQTPAAQAVDAFVITIGNLTEDGQVGIRHRTIRIFRADRARWQGAIHEQLVPTEDRALRVHELPGVELLHHGYLRSVVDGRGKTGRNLALAEAAASAAPADEAARTLLDLARSLAAAGRHEEALARCDEARQLPAPRYVQAWVLRFGAETCLTLGRPAEALEWVEGLRGRGLGSHVADLLEGTALLVLGRGEEALTLLDGLAEAWDATGVSVPEHLVRQRRGLARVAAGDPAGGAIELLAVVTERPAAPVWGQLATAALHSEGRVTASDVAAAIPDLQLRPVLAQLVLTRVDAAEAVSQALWDRLGPDPRLLGFAVHHAPRLDAGRGLEWSARLRAAGLGHHCPLTARAGQEGLPGLERVVAGAVAHGTFGDDQAEREVVAAAPAVSVLDLVDALAVLDGLSPTLLPRFVLAAATDRVRAAALADALDDLGAAEQATLLRTL